MTDLRIARRPAALLALVVLAVVAALTLSTEPASADTARLAGTRVGAPNLVQPESVGPIEHISADQGRETAPGSYDFALGCCVATKGLPNLSDDVIGLSEAHLTDRGDTVLGSFPGYIDKANARGASYFDVGSAWNALSPTERTAANNHFLDVIAGRGDRVLLSTPKAQIQSGTALADEIKYLRGELGYQWVNQWSLRPGSC